MGKSRTLKIVCEQLIKKYPDCQAVDPKTGDDIKKAIKAGYPKIDIRVVIIINGVKAGIESQGDPGKKKSRLFPSLKLFVKIGCKVIICATRTGGETVTAVNRLQNNYEISWIEKCELRKAMHEKDNLEKAAEIIRQVEAVIWA